MEVSGFKNSSGAESVTAYQLTMAQTQIPAKKCLSFLLKSSVKTCEVS